jgi:hypothetical protein
MRSVRKFFHRYCWRIFTTTHYRSHTNGPQQIGRLRVRRKAEATSQAPFAGAGVRDERDASICFSLSCLLSLCRSASCNSQPYFRLESRGSPLSVMKLFKCFHSVTKKIKATPKDYSFWCIGIVFFSNTIHSVSPARPLELSYLYRTALSYYFRILSKLVA